MVALLDTAAPAIGTDPTGPGGTGHSDAWAPFDVTRIELSERDRRRAVSDLDERVDCGDHSVRLLVVHDGDGEQFVAVVLGDVCGRCDVMVRQVDEEILLLVGGRPVVGPQILLGVPPVSALAGATRTDGDVSPALRSLFARSGALSVVLTPG